MTAKMKETNGTRARIEDVAPTQVAAFFEPVWPGVAHPLKHLG